MTIMIYVIIKMIIIIIIVVVNTTGGLEEAERWEDPGRVAKGNEYKDTLENIPMLKNVPF